MPATIEHYPIPSFTSHPYDQASGRFVCIATHPMPADHCGQWMHPDAEPERLNDPYRDHYFCPHCKEHFSCEVGD